MDEKVLFVAPYAILAKAAKEVVSERFAEAAQKIRIVRGDLHECLAAVDQAVQEGFEVIVSRGGTANLIRKHVAIPTVSIQVTGMDVLRALRQCDAYPTKVGIAGFENIIYGCEDLAAVLGTTFVEIALQKEEEAEAKIAAAVEQGVKLIIGDAISTKIAARLGIKAVLIQSGKEAIFKAINEAKMVARVRREEQEKAELLRLVVNKSTEGILAVDVRGRITVLNPMAEKILQLLPQEAVGRPLAEVVPELLSPQAGEGFDKLGEVQRVGDKTLAVKYSPIRINESSYGGIFTFQNVTQLQQIEQNVRKKMHAKGLVAKIKMEDIVGVSEACTSMKRRAVKYALTQSTILVTGESGTGKEMLVQSIHNASPRAQGPFVAVNCAALPENLLESELFGYAEGAFTGAKKGGRQGLFELAHGGTLFLDEIGEMPLALQSRLLRALQEKEVMPLGGDSLIPVDVRIVGATNQNLSLLVEEKKFREDLYYRLNILRIHMPALRERVEDIPLLAKNMLARLQSVNAAIEGIDNEALTYLQCCSWRGNIRQLANTMERAMLLSEGPVLKKNDIKEAFGEEREAAQESRGADNLAVVEADTLLRVLQEEENNYSRAAERLGIHRTTLWRKLNGMNRE